MLIDDKHGREALFDAGKQGFWVGKPIEEPVQVEIEQRHDERGLAAAESGRELTTSGRPSDGGRPQEPRD